MLYHLASKDTFWGILNFVLLFVADQAPWIQVDLEYPTFITGIVTQGSDSTEEWVKTYRIMYGVQETKLKPIEDGSGNIKVYNADLSYLSNYC